MRVLKPEVAKEREEKILRWIIQEYIKTRKAVGSELICEKVGLDISSATIRNIMKKLEDEGFLYQSHTSGGRLPTDKAYRYYVDFVQNMQKYIVEERDRIESEYNRQMEETERLLVHTSHLLSELSRSAGFVYSTGAWDNCICRMDFISLGPRYLLAVVVSEGGAVHHWPIRLNSDISPEHIRLMSSFFNEHVRGLPLKEARRRLWDYLSAGRSELPDMADVAMRMLDHLQQKQAAEEGLYLDGIGNLAEYAGSMGPQALSEMMGIIEEKKRFAGLLSERMKDCRMGKVDVTIGAENELREFKNLSLVSSAYKIGDRTIGMLGIIGPKHMEYERVISLVNFFSGLLERSFEQWGQLVSGAPQALPGQEAAAEKKDEKKKRRRTGRRAGN
ncbi:MAG: heat-inducible transcription repressor HrcA [Elusimicrobia bacterium]|nr:heat-inducible transcription repressor HrcA [Elusimicrobiota bacterium]